MTPTITPSEAAARLGVSERTLRTVAREIGAAGSCRFAQNDAGTCNGVWHEIDTERFCECSRTRRDEMSNHIWTVIGLVGGAMGYGLIFGSDLRIAITVCLGLVVGYALGVYVQSVMK